MLKTTQGTRRIYTSESVTEGHPDKICDQISDAILDAYIAQDPNSRVGVETLIKDFYLIVAGEVTSLGKIDAKAIALKVLEGIGYSPEELVKYGENFQNLIGQQSPDIAQGVDTGGAGDQGIMHGYAVMETPELMPIDLAFAYKLCRKLAEVRKADANSPLLPDGKAQVSVVVEDNKPVGIDSIVVSTQHKADISQEDLLQYVFEKVILPVAGDLLKPITGDGKQIGDYQVNPHLSGKGELVTKSLEERGTILYINPTGNFVIGGAYGDCGLTGRKIVVDNYGGRAPVGGGCFSGKDPSKVDRSGAYMARYLAGWIIKENMGVEALVSLSYAIGVSEPLSIAVSGDLKVDPEEIIAKIKSKFDLSPAGIIKFRHLRERKYQTLWIGDLI
jgi:S-adenosylmethionine synthetase